MSDGNNINGVRQNFVNQPVWKPDNATRPSRPVIKRKSLRVVLYLCKTDMNGVEESGSQSLGLAFVILGRADNFDVCFTMIGDRLHEMARNASRITSSAGRTFALPE